MNTVIKRLQPGLSQMWDSSLFVPGVSPPEEKPAEVSLTAADLALIDKIVRRFAANAHKANRGVVMRAGKQSLMACHGTGTLLDLQALLDAKAPAFRSAVAGIMRHVNPTTGEVLKGFVVPFRKGD